MSDWEGTGPPPAWRAFAVAVLIVGIVGGALFFGMRDRDQLAIETDDRPTGSAPEIVDVVVAAPQQADDTWSCPSTHPVRAFERSREYQPGAYPPDGAARPDDCYASVERAEEAGYRLAEPPPGTELVAGIYLEPTRAPTRDNCRELAGAAGYAVPCPSRLPAPSDGPPCGERFCVFPGPDGLTARNRVRHVGVVIQHGTFTIPPEAPWLGLSRDVVFTAVRVVKPERDGPLRVAGPSEFVSCFPQNEIVARGRTVFRTCVDARPWVPGVGGYPLQRHTAAVWRRGDVVYAAGVEGAGDHVEALLAALIDGIKYVDPA